MESQPKKQWRCPFAGKREEGTVNLNDDLSTSSKCPVRMGTSKTESQADDKKDVSKSENQPENKEKSSQCPVAYKHSDIYNVYNQKIDPKNQMPVSPSQKPAPGQVAVLSTERVKSQIPKAGTYNDTWLYPSPQMFWNAIVRKNKNEGASEQDMDLVVSIHNNMNEKTWAQVLAWEDIHPPKGPGMEPKLLRFLGRPNDMSPKATIKTFFGHPRPFDRHDWFVDRGGQEVRYVIDYYHDEASAEKDVKPKELKDMQSLQSIKVDVRPALDSIQSIVDRLFIMPYRQMFNLTKYSPPPFFAPSDMLQARELRMKTLNKNWADIISQCKEAKARLATCNGESDCGAASVALQRCTAKIVCPTVVEEFDRCVTSKPVLTDKLNIAFAAMETCLRNFEIECRNAALDK